ncbi:uncharacterized protein [Primulina eburnea]|uniref:uncharacterized protein n=1 Tax=Primulina eburnea TaxID=1245227 RepID=UPI003C6C9C1B
MKAANPKDRKVDKILHKILQRISPKKPEDFTSSPIHSLSIGIGEDNDLHKSVEEHLSPNIPVGQNDASNFNHSISKTAGEVLVGETVVNNELEDLTKKGECEFDDTHDFDLEQPEDDQWDEGFVSSDSDSIFSSQAEMQINHESVDMDLQQLFQIEEEKQKDNQTSIQGGGQSFTPDKLGSERVYQQSLDEAEGIMAQLTPQKDCTSFRSEKVAIKSMGKLSRELVRLHSGVNYEKGSASKGPTRLL